MKGTSDNMKKRRGPKEAHSQSKRSKHEEISPDIPALGQPSITEEIRDVDSLSPFEKTPPEIIWKIIDRVPEVVNALRLTSRLIQKRVDDYAMQRTCNALCDDEIPLIRCFHLDFKARKKDPLGALLGMIFVRNQLSALFTLRLRLRQPIVRLFYIVNKGTRDNETTYKFLIESKDYADDDLLQCMNDLFGKRIGHTQLQFERTVSPPYPYRTIRMLLDGIEMKSIRMWMSVDDNTISALIKPILPFVGKFALTPINLSLTDPKGFLLHVSSIVQTVRLLTEDFNGSGGRDESLFFGIPNDEIEPIIVEMFMSKMDKLYINNYENLGFLSLNSVDSLRKKLPLLGKKLWFSTSCNAYPNKLNYQDGEFQVKANNKDLIIAHISRKHEKIGDGMFWTPF